MRNDYEHGVGDADDYEDDVYDADDCEQEQAAGGEARLPKAKKKRKARGVKVVPKKKVPRKKTSRFDILADQTVEEFAQYFRDQQDLTFVFIGDEHEGQHVADNIGPDLVSALEMARCACACDTYESPRSPDRDPYQASCDRANALYGVTLRIDEMLRREDTSFILAWHLRGDLSVHLTCSPDWTPDDIRKGVIGLIQEELHCYFA